LPLANPQTAAELFQIAASIARQQSYEIECLHVIKVPKHSQPDQVSVDGREGRKLLHRLERLGRQWQVPVHTQIRIAQDPAEAILEVIRERYINLLVMGWKGSSTSQQAIFGSLVDSLIERASCDLILIKLGTSPQAYPHQLHGESSWLIPMAGGPNVQRALKFLPGLTGLYARPDLPRLCLCKIYSPDSPPGPPGELQAVAASLHHQLGKPAVPFLVRAPSVPEAIARLVWSENCEAVVLGVSQEGLLRQVIHGNIPEAIARSVECTVILVRGASGLT
jgi:CIC family chloride channel protein